MAEQMTNSVNSHNTKVEQLDNITKRVNEYTQQQINEIHKQLEQQQAILRRQTEDRDNARFENTKIRKQREINKTKKNIEELEKQEKAQEIELNQISQLTDDEKTKLDELNKKIAEQEKQVKNEQRWGGFTASFDGVAFNQMEKSEAVLQDLKKQRTELLNVAEASRINAQINIYQDLNNKIQSRVNELRNMQPTDANETEITTHTGTLLFLANKISELQKQKAELNVPSDKIHTFTKEQHRQIDNEFYTELKDYLDRYNNGKINLDEIKSLLNPYTTEKSDNEQTPQHSVGSQRQTLDDTNIQQQADSILKQESETKQQQLQDQQQIRDLQNQIQRLLKENDDLKQQYAADINKINAEHEQHVVGLQNQIQQRQQQIDMFTQQQEDFDKRKDELGVIANDLEKIRQDVDKQQQELNTDQQMLNIEQEKLNIKDSDLKEREIALNNLETQLSQQQNQLNQQQTEIQQQLEQLANTQQTVEQQQQIQQQLQQLQEQNEKLQQTVDTQNQTIINNDKIINDLQNTANQQQIDNARLQQVNQEQQNQIQQLQNKNVDLSGRVKTFQERAKRLTTVTAKQGNQHAIQQQQLQQRQAEYSQNIRKLKEDNAKEIGKLNQQIQNLQKEKDEMKQQYATEINKMNEDYKQKVGGYEQKIKELEQQSQQQFSMLKGQLVSQQTQLGEQLTTINQYKEQIESLTNENTNLKEQHDKDVKTNEQLQEQLRLQEKKNKQQQQELIKLKQQLKQQERQQQKKLEQTPEEQAKNIQSFMNNVDDIEAVEYESDEHDQIKQDNNKQQNDKEKDDKEAVYNYKANEKQSVQKNCEQWRATLNEYNDAYKKGELNNNEMYKRNFEEMAVALQIEEQNRFCINHTNMIERDKEIIEAFREEKEKKFAALRKAIQEAERDENGKLKLNEEQQKLFDKCLENATKKIKDKDKELEDELNERLVHVIVKEQKELNAKNLENVKENSIVTGVEKKRISQIELGC